MNLLHELNFSQMIAIVAILSSAISIIVNKLFENRQNFLKHKRIIEEKIIDSKLDACKSAIKYYGTFLNYLYHSKSTFESLESYNYSQLLSESNKIYEESLRKIQSDAEFHHIILFYDFYGDDDEKIAEKLKNVQKEYFEFANNNTGSVNLDEEKKMRFQLINTIDEAINYFKNKIKMIREDLQKTIK